MKRIVFGVPYRFRRVSRRTHYRNLESLLRPGFELMRENVLRVTLEELDKPMDIQADTGPILKTPFYFCDFGR